MQIGIEFDDHLRKPVDLPDNRARMQAAIYPAESHAIGHVDFGVIELDGALSTPTSGLAQRRAPRASPIYPMAGII
jgi:hypothetical protein